MEERKKGKKKGSVCMRMPPQCVVCMCVHVHMCAHVCRPQVGGGCLPRLFSTFLGDRSLSEPGAH